MWPIFEAWSFIQRLQTIFPFRAANLFRIYMS